MINYENLCKFMLIRKVWGIQYRLIRILRVKSMGVDTKIN